MIKRTEFKELDIIPYYPPWFERTQKLYIEQLLLFLRQFLEYDLYVTIWTRAVFVYTTQL